MSLVARNEIEIAASPDDVWEVLSDPQAYREWVLGAKEIRGASEGFPETGSELHHTVGAGPLTIKDSTTVVRSERPKVLQLHAKLGPLGSASVTLRLEGEDGRTRVVMHERGARGALQLFQPVNEALLRGRNLISLEKLRDAVERRA
jgi:uncharacterized protein YndB with AHSA1/START domain